MKLNRNALYMLIGGLVVLVVGLGIYIYDKGIQARWRRGEDRRRRHFDSGKLT